MPRTAQCLGLATAVLLLACGGRHGSPPPPDTAMHGDTGSPSDAGGPPSADAAPDEQSAGAGPEAPGGRQLNLSGAGRSPALAISGRRVFLAWVETLADGPAVHFQRSDDEGATFAPVQRLSSPDTRVLFVRMAVHGDRLFVLWLLEKGQPGARVRMRTSTDAGATFGPELSLPVRGLSGVAAEGDSLSVVWWEQPPDFGDEQAELLFQASHDAGKTWGPVQDLNAGREWGDVSLLARGESVWLLWDDRATNDEPAVFLRESADRGTHWGPIVQPAEGARNLRDARMLLQGERLHLAWSQCSGLAFAAPCHIALRTQAGVGQPLGPVQVLSSTPQRAFAPDLAVDGDALHVVWLEGTLQETNVAYRRSLDAGATFLPLQPLTTQPALRLFPRVAAGGGRVGFTWELHQDVRSFLLFREAREQGAVLDGLSLLSTGPNLRGPEVAATPEHFHAVWEEGPFDARRVRSWRH